MTRKRRLIIAIGLLVVSLATIMVGLKLVADKAKPKQPKFKYINGYDDGTYSYLCSKPIKAKLQQVLSDIGSTESYIPVNADEAKLYCYSNAIIENKGKIKVLQKPEVEALLSHFNQKDVTIKALEFKYIEDADYVNRLLPSYQDREIGCIIIIDTPGKDMVYLEDEKLEAFEEMNYQTFSNLLNQASPADRQLFYDNLK